MTSIPTRVLASNVGGGIQRHLDLVASVVLIDVAELGPELSLPEKTRRVRALLSAEQPTGVVTHGVAAGLAARHRGRRLRGLRHVEVWHGDPFFLSARRRQISRVLARLGHAPDLQVFTHEWLVPLYRDPRSPFEVLPNTVPCADLAPHAPGEARRAVFLGRLSPEKGVAELLAAWPTDSAHRGWCLELHGTGPLETGVLPDGVTLHGLSSDPLGLLSGAELVVIPSWTETGPYTACEAMAVGTPFVGSATGDMPEFLSSGCGWEVPPRDVDALRRALVAAQSSSREDLAARGARGRKWLALHRPFDAWAQEVEGIYQGQRGTRSGPSVLYVVPTLGTRLDYLHRTLESIRHQRGVHAAAVLVAPPSATHLEAVARQHGVPLLAQSGTGMTGAINDGWRALGATHDYLAWLGDDDELTPTSAADAVGYLQRHPGAAMVYGQCDYVDVDGALLFRARPSVLAARLLRWGPDLVPQPGSVARASAVRAAGYLDETLRYAMDLDLFLRLADVGRIGYLPRVLARFRWHEGSTTVGAPEASDAEARRVRARTWVGRRRIGFALERPSMWAGRLLHRAQRGLRSAPLR